VPLEQLQLRPRPVRESQNSFGIHARLLAIVGGRLACQRRKRGRAPTPVTIFERAPAHTPVIGRRGAPQHERAVKSAARAQA
jgi:hypothetical protein